MGVPREVETPQRPIRMRGRREELGVANGAVIRFVHIIDINIIAIIIVCVYVKIYIYESRTCVSVYNFTFLD